MATIGALAAPYEEFMLVPRRGPGVCDVCFNLTAGYRRCWACTHRGLFADVVAPISYSVSGGRLHAALIGYKREPGSLREQLQAGLAAVMWRFLVLHEECVAAAASVERFDVVTTVPSRDALRDLTHPLRRVVGELVGPTRSRHRRLLRRSVEPARPHQLNIGRYVATEALDGRSVLLVDDTWTTGGSAQSAAAALKQAGARAVGVVVIGRYLNSDWHANRLRVEAMPRPFDWERCALDVRPDPEPRPWPDPVLGSRPARSGESERAHSGE